MSNSNSTLFSAQATDATSSSYVILEPKGSCAVTGTFDGATVELELSIDGTNFVSAESLTAAAIKTFNFIKGGYIRAKISSAGGSTAITVKVREE